MLSNPADVGRSLLLNRPLTEMGRSDVRSIRSIIVELIDQTLPNGETVSLRNPDPWTECRIVDFLTDTTSKDLDDLAQCQFLVDSEDASCLAIYIERVWHDVYIDYDEID